jgi:cation diffusion facilitator family transporter
MADRKYLTRFAWLSLAAALFTIGLKSAAFALTGSVGLLSDALESGVNLVGALMALAMLTVASRPADEEHAYGHSKAEYFSSVVEGTLILLAATGIIITAIPRLITPQPLEQVGIGLAVSMVASLINFVVAQVVIRAAREHESVTLEANGRHLMTDVWTSIGVIVGVAAVAVTGWLRLDPIIALVVAANIVWTGLRIVRSSASGLMDKAWSAEDQETLQEILDGYRRQNVQFHALRTRQAGARRFVSMHVLVPGKWTVQRGHELVESIDHEVRQALPNVTTFTHLEPLDDPASWEDQKLDRRGAER